MPTSKLTKRAVDALVPPAKKQTVLWDTELKGFGVRVLPSGLKTFIVQYRNAEGIKRRINIARYGVLTVDQARDQAKLKLAAVVGGEDPADEVRQARKGMTVKEMCDWYLTEARAGNILGRKSLPIKKSSLDMDESRIRTHIKPLLGKRIVKHLTIADVEQMQTDVKDGKTAKPRSGGRGGMATGGAGVAARCVGTLQAIIGHAKHKGLLDAHPTQGAKKLAGNKKTRRLSAAEIVMMGKAMAYAERNGENPVALGVLRTLLLTGYRREEGHAFVLDLFYHGYGKSCLTVTAKSEDLTIHAEGIANTEAGEALAARHDQWGEQLPSEVADLWPFLAGLDADSRTALLAHCVSLTINAVKVPWERSTTRIEAADGLAQAVGLDMTARWTATARSYFGRVTKAHIAQAGRLRGEPAARSEAEEAGRKTLRSAPGAEPQAPCCSRHHKDAPLRRTTGAASCARAWGPAVAVPFGQSKCATRPDKRATPARRQPPECAHQISACYLGRCGVSPLEGVWRDP